MPEKLVGVPTEQVTYSMEELHVRRLSHYYLQKEGPGGIRISIEIAAFKQWVTFVLCCRHYLMWQGREEWRH
jgi:hypothetical protein